MSVPDPWELLPAQGTAIKAGFSVIQCSGSANYQQLALQAMLLGVLPGDYGAFSASPLYYEAAGVAHYRAVGHGVPADGPVLLTGHSYGGAVASVLAAIYRFAQPERQIRLVTYGMPKCGDARLWQLLSTVPSVHVVNEGDPIPGCPPSGLVTDGVQPTYPALAWSAWAAWRGPPVWHLLRADGSLTPTGGNPLSLADLWTIARSIFLGGPVPLFARHSLGSYASRLCS